MPLPSKRDEMLGWEVSGYTIEAIIGEGGMGRVYKAKHNKNGTLVALKLLHRSQSEDPNSVGRFFDEAKIVNRLQHPNIVDVSELSTLPDGRPYMLMEFLDGKNLEQHLKLKKKLTLKEAAEIMVQVCDALEAAHQKSIVHRDLKPENIFITRKNNALHVKLLDFGVAKLHNAEGSSRHTKSGMLLGTPRYMSPEQAIAPREVNGRSDLYAVGVILYEMICGKPPFEASSTVGLLFQHRDEPPPAPSTIVPGLPKRLNELILRCLAKSYKERPASAKEVSKELRSLAGLPPLQEDSSDTNQTQLPALREQDKVEEGANFTQETELPAEFVASAKNAEKKAQSVAAPSKSDPISTKNGSLKKPATAEEKEKAKFLASTKGAALPQKTVAPSPGPAPGSQPQKPPKMSGKEPAISRQDAPRQSDPRGAAIPKAPEPKKPAKPEPRALFEEPMDTEGEGTAVSYKSPFAQEDSQRTKL